MRHATRAAQYSDLHVQQIPHDADAKRDGDSSLHTKEESGADVVHAYTFLKPLSAGQLSVLHIDNSTSSTPWDSSAASQATWPDLPRLFKALAIPSEVRPTQLLFVRSIHISLPQVIPYYTQHGTQIALRVRERKMSFSGDDFTIKDAVSGAVMFKVDGSALALRDNKSEC
jgi:hypothetical protein